MRCSIRQPKGIAQAPKIQTLRVLVEEQRIFLLSPLRMVVSSERVDDQAHDL